MQTALNKELGYICLGLLYGLFAFSALVAPFFVNKAKPVIIVPCAALAYIWVVAANIRVDPGALLSGCGAVGIAAAMLWSGQGLYVTQASVAYADVTGVSISDASSLMNRAFFGIFTSSGGTSYLMASLILLFAKDGISLLFIILVGIGLGGVLLLSCLTDADDDSTQIVSAPFFLSWFLKRRKGDLTTVAEPTISAAAPAVVERKEAELIASAEASSVDTREVKIEGESTSSMECSERPVEGDDVEKGSPSPSQTVASGSNSNSDNDAKPMRSNSLKKGQLPPGKGPPPSLWYMMRFLVTQKHMLLLTPVVLAFGAQMGAFNTIWVGSLAGQAVGPQYVGFVGCVYSWSTSLATWAWGKVGRPKAFFFSALLYVAFWSASMIWATAYPPLSADDGNKPSLGATLAFLFIGAGVYAAADGVWYVQVPAILQTLYHGGADAACVNAAIRLHTSLGFAVQAAISASIGPGHKLPQQMGACMAFMLLSCASLYYLHVAEVDIGDGKKRRPDVGSSGGGGASAGGAS